MAINTLEKKIHGKAQGYSCCGECGMPWLYVKGVTIEYNEFGSGMFPVCEECFGSLTLERIDCLIDDLVSSWVNAYRKLGRNWGEKQTPEQIAVAAKARVRIMKSISRRHRWTHGQ